MRKLEHVSYNEFIEAVNSLHNVECIGCIDGCLLDDLLYIGDNDCGCEIVLAISKDYTTVLTIWKPRPLITIEDNNPLKNTLNRD